jgi:hypothetical protein
VPTYTAIPADHVSDVNDKYQKAALKLKTEKDPVEINRLKGLLTLYEEDVKEHLHDDMETLTRNFAAHQNNIDGLVAGALDNLKWAKTTTAKYKSKPDPQFPPQVKNFVDKINKAATDAKADALAFGDAWKGYRENVAKDVPAPVIASAEATRKSIINNSKITSAKILKITAAANEAEALLDIVGKATRKRVEKADRPLADAQKAARDLSKKMADLLTDARTPPGRGTQPNSIRSGSDNLVAAAANKTLTANPSNLSDNEGRWATVDASWKGLNTRAAGMAKVLENSQKGFRSTELKDPVVKAELVKAAKSLADVKADVKLYAPYYAKAQTAIKKIQAAFKAKKK